MPSEPLGLVLNMHCKECRFWIAAKYHALHIAGNRGVDEAKVLEEVAMHRAHSVMSEAHFHHRNEYCNERCVA